MTPEEIKKKVLQYKWNPWVDRPFGVFIMSVFKAGNGREVMKRTGVDVELPAMLFQKGNFYKSIEVWDLFADELRKHLAAGGTVKEIVERCERFGNESRVRLGTVVRSDMPALEKLAELHDILAVIFSYVWLTHGFEYIYDALLHREVPKYMDGDVDHNIGNISFPIKKNTHVYFDEALRSNKPLEEVRERFGWIKVRDGFSDIFTLEELAAERERMRKAGKPAPFVRPEVPEPLRELAATAQELVYWRTMRTDFLYEFMYRCRPFLIEIARQYGVGFKDLRDYAIYDLIEGKPEKYEYGNYTALSFGSEFALLHGSVLEDDTQGRVQELKGAVAFRGKVRGPVKIVMTAQQIDKVRSGDVLVAPTTAPSYIIGMQKAAAFVTDEGGITSHAAIVSREMKKPCIIGTKRATRVLKDGDVVEVDAERGIVRIIKD